MSLSDAFPKISRENIKLFSPMHKLLKSEPYKILENTTKFYNYITLSEIEELKNYHNEWFPIEYSDRFYNKIFNKEINILLIKIDIYFEKSKLKKKNIIIGLLTYRKENANNLYINLKKRVQSFFKDFFCAHILTLGILYEFRKLKLGTKLLKFFFDNIKGGNFEYVILETTGYNKTAIGYYKKNGFVVDNVIKDFYFIDGFKYDAVILKFDLKT